MFESIAPSLAMPATKSHDVLSEVLRHGAPRLLGQAIEAEVQDWLESHKHILDPNGHRQVVGNGRLPTRSIVTGLGAVEVRQRRIHDRRIVGENDRGEPVDADGQAIESTFATVRLRHRKTKGSGSRVACLTMVFKLMQSAAKTWRALNGSTLLADVIAGVPFADGVKKAAA